MTSMQHFKVRTFDYEFTLQIRYMLRSKKFKEKLSY